MKNAETSKYGTDFISALNPAKYNYKEEMQLKGIDTSEQHFGVMAQSINNYLKSVSNEKFNIIQYDSEGTMMVNYNELIAPMIKTIQELIKRIERLENKIDNVL